MLRKARSSLSDDGLDDGLDDDEWDDDEWDDDEDERPEPEPVTGQPAVVDQGASVAAAMSDKVHMSRQEQLRHT